MLNKKQFLDRVGLLSGLRSQAEIEKACLAVFQATRELLQSEEIEELVSDRLRFSRDIKEMWDNPRPGSVQPASEISDDDVVKPGHEPEELAIEVTQEEVLGV